MNSEAKQNAIRGCLELGFWIAKDGRDWFVGRWSGQRAVHFPGYYHSKEQAREAMLRAASGSSV